MLSGNYSSKKPKLIPIEIERLEYLISYCLKNMYIKLANEPQTLLASNENLQSEADVFLSELFERDEKIESISIALSNRDELISKMDDEIIQLKQDIAVTEANTELFREVHLSAYNKMIKIKEIIGC
jgi:predicted nuclease with TOPRIM domain